MKEVGGWAEAADLMDEDDDDVKRWTEDKKMDLQKYPSVPLTPLALARLAYASDSQRALACTFKGSFPFPAQRGVALRVPNCIQHATPDLYFLLLPPGSTTCIAHCVLRSKLHYHPPRLAAAWGSGITGSGLSSPFPLLRSTQSRSDRAENFEANTHPYRIPTLLPYTSTQPLIQLTPVSIDTTIRL